MATFTDTNIKSDGVEFGMASPEEIRQSGVMEITRSELYGKGLPLDGAVNDMRLGTTESKYRCATCKRDVKSCMGHPAYLNLSFPVPHYLCMDKIVKVLRCVCFWCSSLLVDKDNAQMKRKFSFKRSPSDRLAAISTYCKKKTCTVCQGPCPEYNRNGPYLTCSFPEGTVFADAEEEAFAREPFDAKKARQILEQISDENCEFIGINPNRTRPEWMILTVLLIPPTLIRPTTSISDGSRTKGHDDLTSLLREISKHNFKLRDLLEDPGAETFQEQFTLTYHELLVQCATYFDKDGGTSSQQFSIGGTGVARTTKRPHLRSGPMMSLGKRLVGKRGRFRGTMMGKRCDFTSRSVITPNPNIDIHQLVVPTIVARTQTIPEKVTAFNVHDLRKRVLRGYHKKGGGAHKVIRPDGVMYHLGMTKDLNLVARALAPGWTVYRQIKTGDVGLFNRQPTLHKQSMMCHELIVGVDQKTFGLPVPVTSPYNADFDGDEMNLHVLQNFMAIAEAKHICGVPHQLLSAKDSKPCIGLVQDAVIGSYLLTSKDTFLTRSQFFDGVMCAKYMESEEVPIPAIFGKRSDGTWDVRYTGKQLASYVLPKKVSMQKCVRNLEYQDFDSVMDIDERMVIIRDGELLTGKLCKASVGSSNRGIVHRTVHEQGGWRASHWVSDMQRVACHFMSSYGFSIGFEDILHSKEIQEKIDLTVESAVDAVVKGEALARKAGVDEDRIEGERMRVLSNVLNDVGRICLSMDENNSILQCIEAGSKGKRLNACQIHGVVGQQVVGGKRVQYRTDPTARTLPCYEAGDTDPVARGFVNNSYTKGLDPRDYFCHHQGGREGLIDTACKTAETGYLQRRMGKILESEHACTDGSVRDSHDHIILTKYGGDKMNSEFLVKVRMPVLGKEGTADEVAARWCGGTGVETDVMSFALFMVRKALLFYYETCPTSLYLPFDPWDFVPSQDPTLPFLDADVCREMVAATEERIVQLIGDELSCINMLLALRMVFVAKRLRCVSTDVLQERLDIMVDRVERCIIENGEMVGIISAQSIGEVRLKNF